MATMVKSFAIQGIDGYVVDIEAKTLDGQPMITIIGMGDQAVREAADRIESAIDESGYTFPIREEIELLQHVQKKYMFQNQEIIAELLLLQNMVESMGEL